MLVIILFFISLSAQAQAPPAFEAILYNDNVGEFIVVDETGAEIERTTLPALGSQIPSDDIAVSPDGNRIAYVLQDTNSNAHDLMIYDRQQNTIAATYRIPNSTTTQSVNTSISGFISNTLQNSAFDQTGQFFAFGYNTGFTNWEAIVLDINNNTVRQRLNNTNATFPTTNNMNLVLPRQLDGQFLHFTMIATATGGSPVYPSYRWDTTMTPNNRLTATETHRSLESDFLDPVNHHIMATPDFRLPNIQYTVRGPAVQFNALHAATANDAQTFPVYNAQNLTLSMPRFIQNGTRIAVMAQTYPAYENQRWLVINPNTGQQEGTLGINSLAPHELLGLPTGLIYSARATDIRDATGYLPSPNAATTALMYIDTTQSYTGNAGQRIWLDDPNQFSELVWVNNRANPPVTPLSWNTLTVPDTVDPYVPGADCNRSQALCGAQQSAVNADPCPTNPAICDITRGDLVSINTTEGDVVNLRDFPNVDADNVIVQLADGTEAQVIDGPENADGFLWWQIETNNGQTGWIVERVNDVQVLRTIDPQTGQPPQTGGNATLSVGGQAQVTNTGDNLNARTQPSLNNPVLAILRAGTIVDVVGGPVQADGFTWWEVETSEGNAWVADGTANENWLTPTTASANINTNQPAVTPPIAAFSWQINGATVNFTSNARGDVASQQWSFGDGSTSTQANPSHTYRDAGTYNVTLQVTGPNGSQDSFTDTITLNVGSGGGASNNTTTTIDMSSYTSDQFIPSNYFQAFGIQQLRGAPQGSYCSSATSPAIVEWRGRTILTTADPNDLTRCNTVPMSVDFASPQQSVTLTFTGAEDAYEMTVFDTNGNVIATQTQTGVLDGTTTISYTSSARNIARIRFGLEAAVTGIMEIAFE